MNRTRKQRKGLRCLIMSKPEGWAWDEDDDQPEDCEDDE